MDHQTILALQSKQGVKTITVQFFNFRESGGSMSHDYTYKTMMDDLEPGDLVVVEARDWYQVARVEQIHDTVDFQNTNKLRWALLKVNEVAELSALFKKSEDEALRKLVEARALKQAQEVLAASGIENPEQFSAVPDRSRIDSLLLEVENAEVVEDD